MEEVRQVPLFSAGGWEGAGKEPRGVEGLALIQKENPLKEGLHPLHGVQLTPSRCHGFAIGTDSGGGRL